MSFGFNVAITNILICSIFSYLLAPFIKSIGIKFNIVDIPDFRKVHKKPIVRIGGLSIFLVFSLYLFLTKLFISFKYMDGDFLSKFYIFLIGGALFFLIGIHDDIFKSSPFLRLCLQFAVAFFVSLNGIKFGLLNFSFPLFGEFNILLPDILIYVVSAFWIVGITNAINWLDGIDALAGGYCAILSFGLFILMLQKGNLIGILFFSVILGCILGFLFRNLKPAYYIMGDCGSNFLGYCLSASSLLFLPNSLDGSIQIIYLLIIFSLPVGDMFLVIFGRLIKKQNLFLPDKNHIHHRLMNLNINYKNIICLLFSYSAITISIGLLSFKN